jgi:hypothetical protein
MQQALEVAFQTQRVISQRTCLGGFFVMERKRRSISRENTGMPPQWLPGLVANSPLLDLPITQSVFSPATRPLAARLSAGF